MCVKKNKIILNIALIILLFNTYKGVSQNNSSVITNLNEISVSESGIFNYWLEMGSNTNNQPILIPVIVIQGVSSGPTLGLTAAIHGNELNGISIIHRLIDSVQTNHLKGRIIAIPGLNSLSVQLDQRRFIDDEDLNRNFPGKKNGSESEQFVYKIKERVLPSFDILIDMHTASFGRVNTMYARADSTNDTILKLAELQQPDIILNSKGKPSFGPTSAATETLRAEAASLGIPCITVEYGNPQVFQNDLTIRGLNGIFNTLKWLNMYYGTIGNSSITTTYCKKSYWIYMEEGGFLDVVVDLNQHIKKGDPIGIVKNAFGELITTYYAPEDGVIIGKSTNPQNMSGGRIIHLGVLE
jgi:hypothetical protein